MNSQEVDEMIVVARERREASIQEFIRLFSDLPRRRVEFLKASQEDAGRLLLHSESVLENSWRPVTENYSADERDSRIAQVVWQREVAYRAFFRRQALRKIFAEPVAGENQFGDQALRQRVLVESMFEEFENHPCVRVVTVEDSQLWIYLITINSRRTAEEWNRYEIGDFTITWDPYNDEIRTPCLRPTYDVSVHPWFYEGTVCFGDAKSEMVRFLHEGLYHSLVDLSYKIMTDPQGCMWNWRRINDAE